MHHWYSGSDLVHSEKKVMAPYRDMEQVKPLSLREQLAETARQAQENYINKTLGEIAKAREQAANQGSYHCWVEVSLEHKDKIINIVRMMGLDCSKGDSSVCVSWEIKKSPWWKFWK
jgi:predicted metal-dependent hydrolase